MNTIIRMHILSVCDLSIRTKRCRWH